MLFLEIQDTKLAIVRPECLKRIRYIASQLSITKAEEGLQTSDFRLQTSDFRLSSSEFDWDVGFPASAILIAVIIKIDEGVCCKLS